MAILLGDPASWSSDVHRGLGSQALRKQYSWMNQFGEDSQLNFLDPSLLAQVQAFMDDSTIPQGRKNAVLSQILGYGSNLFARSDMDAASEFLIGHSNYQQQMQAAGKYIGELLGKQQEADYLEDYGDATSQIQREQAAGINSDLAGNVDAGEGVESAPVDTTRPDFTIDPMQTVATLGSVASSCFNTICGMFQTYKSMQLADSQIAVMGEQASLLRGQSELVGQQSSLAAANIANVDAMTEKQLQDAAKQWVRETFNTGDFERSLSDFALSQSDVNYNGKTIPFSKLPRAEQISRYINNRAISYASDTLPASIRGRWNTLVKEFSNPENQDFKTWLSEMKARSNEGDLRSEQSLLLLNEYANGFGRLTMATQRRQLEMQQELFKYQASLYKQFEQQGLAKEETAARVQALVTERKTALLQESLVYMQQEKLNSLMHIEKWLDGKPKWIRGFGQWVLPSVAESLDKMIINFGASFGQSRGAAVGNPVKEVFAPAAQGIGNLIH